MDVSLVLDLGQFAVLCGIFFRLGNHGAQLAEHKARLKALEKSRA